MRPYAKHSLLTKVGSQQTAGEIARAQAELENVHKYTQ